jgi:putative sterol carrier protein
MDSYVKLQKLTEPTRPALAATFDRVAEILGEVQRRPLQLQFSLVDGGTEEPVAWTVAVDKDGGKAAQRLSKKPDVEIITREETWWEIANGELPPLEAFVSGRMRVRGNIGLAKRIFLIDLAAEPTELPEWLR